MQKKTKKKASNDDHTQVELVDPPAGSKPGERVTFDGSCKKEIAFFFFFFCILSILIIY